MLAAVLDLVSNRPMSEHDSPERYDRRAQEIHSANSLQREADQVVQDAMADRLPRAIRYGGYALAAAGGALCYLTDGAGDIIGGVLITVGLGPNALDFWHYSGKLEQAGQLEIRSREAERGRR